MANVRDDAMDLRRLAYFVAVAEELHFGRAASRLSIAQPPLSRQIAQLETDLGVMLFDRSRSQIRLTQAGAVLLDHARDVLDRLDQTQREVKRIGEGISGRLRIAFVGSATYGVLPNVIKTYRSAYPDVELALSAMNNAALKRAVIQREIDIGAEICGHTFVDGMLYVLRGRENKDIPNKTEEWRIGRLNPREEVPEVDDLATIPFAARSLTHDGEEFWSNHRAANETISFTISP